MEYTQMLPVEGLATHFTFPLKPSWGEPQRAGEFAWHVRVVSDHKIAAPQFTAQSYPLRVLQAGEHEFEGDFSARNLLLSEDFALDYQMSVPASELSFTAYRAPEHISAYDLRDPALAQPNPDGYFSARALFNQPVPSLRPARNILLVLDISLSMYGEKLVRAAEAAEFLLHNLGPDDHFNLMLFNETAHPLAPEPLTGTPENVEKALAFLKASALAAGTDLQNALAQAVKLTEKFPAGERSIILISDANPTWGTSNVKKILAGLPGEKEETGPAGRLAPAPAAPVRIFAFGLGRDANQTLLEELARQTHGHFAQARETEDISAALRLFLAHIGTPDWENLRLSGPADFYQVYALQDYAADGSSAAWVGRYRRPAPRATLNFTAQRGAETINLTRDVMLPELDDTHAHLPRLWARARVDALLRALDLDGEREDYISEIIRLSQRYKFVTPYTSFLAAPRSLLRPRLIQPGDPVLRVRTDESIVAVWAVLPFGETLPLHYLPQQKVWQCRFLAPSWLSDGTYRARLLLTDQDGNGYQEEKTFVIDSHAPSLRATLDKQQVHAGEELTLRVTADSDTFRLHAKMYGAQPAELRWSDADKANTGRLRVPAGLSAGRYIVTVTAEDFAHNQASLELEIEVL
jgi:Ca-activated chloride channel family protein